MAVLDCREAARSIKEELTKRYSFLPIKDQDPSWE